MARLLILKQCKVLDTERNDIEFDRFVALAKRIFHAPIAMISFIDYDRQWIKSCVGGKISNPNVPRSDSIDADLMFPDAHEIKLILNGDEQDKLTRLVEKLGLQEQLPLRFYIGAAIIIDGFKLGVLSLFDNEPHDYVSLDNRQNLVDLAAAVSNLVKERRLRNLQLRKQKANLMLGLNHNLRTPLMSLTLVTEMLRAEIKGLAKANRGSEIGSRKCATPVDRHHPRVLSHKTHHSRTSSFNQSVFSSHANSAKLDGWTVNELPSEDKDTSTIPDIETLKDIPVPRDEPFRSAFSSAMSSLCSSVGHTPDIPCINLISDLQDSLQQLSLLVEMGLVLGKITSGMSVLADGTYDSIQCDLLKVYEKVRNLTQRLGRSQNVLWAIDKSILSKGKHFSHPDVLLFVLISSLSQVLPHADWVRVKASFIPIEDVTRLLEDDNDIKTMTSIMEITAPPVVFGKVGMLLTELEIFGDSDNLKEIVSKLHATEKDSTSSSRSVGSSSVNSDGRNGDSEGACVDTAAEAMLQAEVEDFGGSLFALGNLLENVLGGSSYIITSTGCTFSFSIPCRVEMDDAPVNEPELLASITCTDNKTEEREACPVIGLDLSSLTFPSEKRSLGSVLALNHSDNCNPDGYCSSSSSSCSGVADGMTAGHNDETTALTITTHPSSDTLFSVPHYNKNGLVLSTEPSVYLTRPFLYDSSYSNTMTSSGKDSNNRVTIVAPYYSSSSHKQDMLQVLIIDDSVTVQKVMTIWLKKKKCQVTTALNGAIALDLLKTNAYDLVLLDFLMPVMDGLTCLHAFHDWLLHSPPEVLPQGVVDQWIIGLSATALKTDWQDAFAAGLDMFCSKPVDMQALGYVIEAKKLGISMKKLLELVANHNNCTMTEEQQDMAVDIMFPLLYNNTNLNNNNKTNSTNPSHNKQQQQDREVVVVDDNDNDVKARGDLKASLIHNEHLHIFGSFVFNPRACNNNTV
eukprot:scaffold1493_cov172-Ochromonas_danica.AAC.4